MSRELWVLRHAKAEQNITIDDFDRALKKRGKQAAQRMGEWLKQQQLIPDLVISSPAKRAITTAKRVLEAMDVSDVTITEDKRVYAEGFERLKTVLAECPAEAQRVLLVGHNPELEDLLVHLVGIDQLPDSDKLLPTTAFARLEMPDDWTQLSAGSAHLLSITLVKSLP
ncbi:MAG: histidine phosphatase family protein [Methylococcales bacterium]|nr:histidine phosphatase family protein [Methylococcales bacterium]MDP3838886.1 histidine phosphatase family protein [Methylococcales bacterium]